MSKIAVIMSVYCNDDCVLFQRALDSILDQTVPSTLYLYIDGWVPDQVDDVVKRYAVFPNVKVYRGDVNVGLAHALNNLIDVLEGYDFIARMDSDDWSTPDRLEKQCNFLVNNRHIDVCGSYCKEVGDYPDKIKVVPVDHQNLAAFSVTRCPFIHPTVVFRASVFHSGVRYPIDTKFTEDMGLWLCLLDNGYVFANISEVLLEFTLKRETLKRRQGFAKGCSEFYLRLRYILKLKKLTVSNIILIVARLFLHSVPFKLFEILYFKLR
jgi:glycosyltransferase involved in cell wall biosynthesis